YKRLIGISTGPSIRSRSQRGGACTRRSSVHFVPVEMQMVRARLMRGKGGDHGFRWRGREVSRIEGLSDAVFGFAIPLLVISLEVPQTFGQLLQAMKGMVAF